MHQVEQLSYDALRRQGAFMRPQNLVYEAPPNNMYQPFGQHPPAPFIHPRIIPPALQLVPPPQPLGAGPQAPGVLYTGRPAAAAQIADQHVPNVAHGGAQGQGNYQPPPPPPPPSAAAAQVADQHTPNVELGGGPPAAAAAQVVDQRPPGEEPNNILPVATYPPAARGGSPTRLFVLPGGDYYNQQPRDGN